jgi:tRNA(adenine34) deaminase
MIIYDDAHYMNLALQQAQYAYDDDEVPVGALIIINNKIIARAHNQVERLNDPTAHAEILAVTSACNNLGAKYLPDAVLYVTVEPCHMCAGALYWSKISRIVYGASDVKNGYQRFCGNNNPFHPKTEITRGVLATESAKLMQDFFKQKR